MNPFTSIPKFAWKKAGLLGSLYVAQFLPLAFFLQTLPAFMRQQGMSVEAIGLTSLLGLPWMLKFLWSPLVDRYSLLRLGHYKSWILVMQGLMIVVLLLCGFLNLTTQFWLLLATMLLVVMFASTQDIAVDALAVGLLTPQERGMGNAIQGGGNYLGAILGGGLLLVLLDSLGWQGGLWVMAGCIAVLMLPVLLHPERRAISESPIPASEQHPAIAYVSLFTSFCRRSNMGRWLLLLLVYNTGTSMTNTMFRPLLVDIGLSLSQIGWMYGMAAYSAGLLGSLVAGVFIKPLGRVRSLLFSTLLLAGANTLHFLPAWGFTNLTVLYGVSTLFNFVYGMTSVALSTMMMDNTRLKTAGTDYTLQATILFIGSLVAAGISGFLATSIGYSGVFITSGAITLVNAIIVAKGDFKYGEGAV
mgnify:CR=1 FL=1